MPPKRAFKPVPDGYVCAACKEAGHWIYDCSQYKKKKKKKASNHEFQAGVDPSPEDIERAKRMQMEMKELTKTAPNCFCGLPAKMRKCIRTEDESSRAKGVMFWWCNKDKWDEGACKFARPVTQKKKVCQFWKVGDSTSCKKGSACKFWHEGEVEVTDRSCYDDKHASKAALEGLGGGRDGDGGNVEVEVEPEEVEKVEMEKKVESDSVSDGSDSDSDSSNSSSDSSSSSSSSGSDSDPD